MVEHYGWCSTCILRIHGEDALNDVLYPLDFGDDLERMFVDEDSCLVAPCVEDDVWAPLFLEYMALDALEVDALDALEMVVLGALEMVALDGLEVMALVALEMVVHDAM